MSASRENRASFSRLNRSIRGWTSRMLVTAVMLALSLALGWQVSAWWHDKPRSISASETMAARLAQLGPEREFLTTNGLLQVEPQTGELQDAIDAMKAFCRQKGTSPRGKAAGPDEAKFVAELLAEPPLEESPPLALYQPPGQSMMVLAINRDSQQIVSWSFAVPSGGRTWSLYHFRPK